MDIQTDFAADIVDDDRDTDHNQPSGRRKKYISGYIQDFVTNNAAKNEDIDGDKHSNMTQFDADTRCDRACDADPSRIKSLEDEQEMLSSSLFALTSHFAQVQFRLRQIVDSPADQRDQLLQDLEEFAFRGIPDSVTSASTGGHSGSSSSGSTNASSKANDMDQHELFEAMEMQRARQIELIEQLKRQLTDVEKFAYESGSKILPQSVMVEKQRVIIDELRDKLNLNMCDDDLPQLSSEQLRNQVDTALVQLVGPVKAKDTLVEQLKTQIVDLERFVACLQCESYDLKQMTKTMGFQNCESAFGNTYNSKMAKSSRSRIGSTTSNGSSNGGGVVVGSAANPTVAMSPQSSSELRAESMPNSGSLTACQSDDGVGTTSQSPTTADSIGRTSETLSEKAAGVLDKVSNILNMFAVTQLGCGSQQRFQKNTLKRTSKGNHWGDLRAQLEIDVQEIISLVSSVTVGAQRLPKIRPPSVTKSRQLSNRRKNTAGAANLSEDSSDDNDIDDDTDDSKASARWSKHRFDNEMLANLRLEITAMVRKHLSITLQRLIEHGLCEQLGASVTSGSLVPFMGCFARRSSMTSTIRRHHDDADDGFDGDHERQPQQQRQMHAWELCLEYYHIKNGEQFNETPARMLSQSFNLDISDGSSSTSSTKQSLLSAIGNIINTHSPYKRSANSHFKALISEGLNCQKLSQWLNLLFQCRELVQQYYTDWSYVRRTGFRDGLKSLDRLSCYHFELPVDLAIRQFQNIKDVF